MPIFNPGDVVRVPFPYTSGTAARHRPALVVARIASESGAFLLWVVMITSATNRAWPGDVAVPDHGSAGLPVPSVVRSTKIATIDAAVADQRGRVTDATLAQVRANIAAHLSLGT